MPLDQKTMQLGHVYRIYFTGVTHNGLIAVVTGFDLYERAIVRLLNAGFAHGAALKREDYIPFEHFADSENDPKVVDAVAQKEEQ